MVRMGVGVKKEDKQNSKKPITLHGFSTWEGNQIRLIRLDVTNLAMYLLCNLSSS